MEFEIFAIIVFFIIGVILIKQNEEIKELKKEIKKDEKK